MTIRVLLADDHTIMRQGLMAILKAEANIQVIGQAKDGLEVLKILESQHPDVLVLDISMPNLGGLETAELVRDKHRDIRTVILSVHESVAYAAEAMRRGAKAYVFKKESLEQLIYAIHQVMDDETYLSPPLTLEAVAEYRRKTSTGELDPFDTLTPTEKIVFYLTIKGLSSRKIASQLDISSRTVESHRASILNKLSVSNTVELVRYAAERGFIHQSKKRGKWEKNP